MSDASWRDRYTHSSSIHLVLFGETWILTPKHDSCRPVLHRCNGKKEGRVMKIVVSI